MRQRLTGLPPGAAAQDVAAALFRAYPPVRERVAKAPPPEPIMRIPCIALGLVLVSAACASGQQPANGTIFRDVTATHLPQDPELHALDGVLVDVDGDGDLDIAVAVEGGMNRLYINDGQGRFSWREGALDGPARDNEHVLSAD